MKYKILIVDDEPDMLSTCKATLSQDGVTIILEQKAATALERLKKESFDLMITDIKMPKISGIELLKQAKPIDPELPILLMTAYPEVNTAVEALRSGAVDYLIKPFHPEELQERVRRALNEKRLKGEPKLLSRHIQKEYKAGEIIGESKSIQSVLELVEKIAPTPTDVLILGESGTGKELIARRIHAKSGRKGRFVPVDCGAIPEQLLENELFGHVRGAYTDAQGSTPGLLEFAHEGSFFMDEICEMPASLQAKLLRTLQERQFRRLGSNELISVDIRLLTATNRDIENEVKQGRFRKDLYYRLNTMILKISPLRERPEDIPLLVQYFLPRFCRELGKNPLLIEEEAMEILQHYSWPGNVRELQSILEKAVILCEGNVLKANDLPESLIAGTSDETGCREPNGFFDMRNKRIHTFEKEYIQSLLKKFQGDVKACAKAASLPLSSFYFYLKKHGIKPESFRS